jgi:DNA-binding MarR family transcriptional regulator
MAVFGRIAKIHRAQLRASDEAYRDFDISHGDFDVLATLRRSGEPFRLTPSELTGQMMISSGGVTQRVDRLCKLGLVERLPHETDRRSTTVGLTALGRSTIDQALPLHIAAERGLLSPLSSADQARLIGLLARIAVAIE